MAVKVLSRERWRELLDERVAESVAALGSVPGVCGLVVGGSVGRDEPWPLSDIDLLPVVVAGRETGAEIERRHAALIDWWAASGRAQTLDVGWLSFSDEEAKQALQSGPAYAAKKMSDLRWLHGLDKSYGGYGAADPDGLADAFAKWATAVRFDPLVIAARVREWTRQTVAARDAADEAAYQGDPAQATVQLRQSARALRLVLIEGWGERLGSMGREWTRFERSAERHGAADLAVRLADLAGADVRSALARAQIAPAWLNERIDLGYAARLAVGEDVTPAENARDQIAAFAVHVSRHHPEHSGDWAGVPAPNLEQQRHELDQLISVICPAEAAAAR